MDIIKEVKKNKKGPFPNQEIDGITLSLIPLNLENHLLVKIFTRIVVRAEQEEHQVN
jgi:hypothetical protein